MGPNFRKNFFFVKQYAFFFRAGNFEPDSFPRVVAVNLYVRATFNLHILGMPEIDSFYIRFSVRNLHKVESRLVGFPEILRVDASGIISRERPHLLGLVDMTKCIVISSD